MFHKMDSTKWKSFKKSTKLVLAEDGLLITNTIPPNPSLGHLNFLNNKLEELLIRCAKKDIPTKLRRSDSFNMLKPKDLVLLKRYLTSCNRVNRLLSKRGKHFVLNN